VTIGDVLTDSTAVAEVYVDDVQLEEASSGWVSRWTRSTSWRAVASPF
jgi:hypothetical protein